MWNSCQVAVKPKISVVVASYNYAGYIGATLDSILHQTCPADEIIVVDDVTPFGAPDRCRAARAAAR